LASADILSMSVHIRFRVLSLGYVSFRQMRVLVSPFPPVGSVAAPCGALRFPTFAGVGSEEARLRASLRPPLKLHVHISRMQLSRRLTAVETQLRELIQRG